MTRIVPTQIVETIDRLFTGPSRGAGTAALTDERICHLQGTVHLLRQLPNELLAVDAKDFADLTVATAAIELIISRWTHDTRQTAIPPISGKDVIHTIRDVLKKCPDQFPPAETAALSFISDQQVRDSMRQDIGAADAALQNAEWKAATILGGAAIEALLHWKLSELQQSGNIHIAHGAAQAVSSGKLKTKPSGDLDRWDLIEFIAVARELDVITEESYKQAERARDYRNLIHPGKAVRRQIVPDRATALTVMAGLAHVIRDFGR